jgi:hypothetical protein
MIRLLYSKIDEYPHFMTVSAIAREKEEEGGGGNKLFMSSL